MYTEREREKEIDNSQFNRLLLLLTLSGYEPFRLKSMASAALTPPDTQ